MIKIKDLKVGTTLEQIKDIYYYIKVGYIGKKYKVENIEEDKITLDVKIDGKYLEIREKNLNLFKICY